MFKGHGPSKGRESGVIKAVESMFLKKMFEDVSQQQDVRQKAVVMVLM